MYLHIGQDVVLRQKDILGVFDMDNTTISRATRDFLTQAEKEGRVDYVTMELPKSFVVCVSENKKDTVYISQLAPSTLRKRARRMNTLITD
ncbi:MAG: DUF370 domain-containing protein [Clostridia bacterium]|nr:DUF370 domain-containing protein [Clostridia bacterium]